MDKAIEHGLRLCMVRSRDDDPWEWAWFHLWTFDADNDMLAIVEQEGGTTSAVMLGGIRFPNTPALPKHAPPEVE